MRPPKVLIRRALIETFDQAVRSCRSQKEVGGILLGSYRGPHIEVTGITVPGPADISSTSTFIRRDRSHQVAAKKAWSESGGTVTYLGEWHTHPAGGPAPSGTDLNAWFGVADQVKKPAVFIIASPGGWAPFVCDPELRMASGLQNVEVGLTGDVFAESHHREVSQCISSSHFRNF